MKWVAFGLMVIGGIVEILSFGRAVEIESTNFRESWLKDGEPSRYGLGNAALYVFTAWLFETPGWAKQSPEAMRHIVRGRVGAALMFVGVISLLIALTSSTL